MKSHWIEHKGKRILLLDYSNFGTNVAGVAEEIAHVVAVIEQQPEGSILGLCDATGSRATPGIIAVLKKETLRTQRFYTKLAVIGVDSALLNMLTSAVLKFAGVKNSRIFKDVAQAKDWLTEEAGS
jgi:hypothetical protein